MHCETKDGREGGKKKRKKGGRVNQLKKNLKLNNWTLSLLNFKQMTVISPQSKTACAVLGKLWETPEQQKPKQTQLKIARQPHQSINTIAYCSYTQQRDRGEKGRGNERPEIRPMPTFLLTGKKAVSLLKKCSTFTTFVQENILHLPLLSI